MTIEEFRAGLHAWRNRQSSIPNCLWRDGVELKEKGRKFKAVGISYFGNDPEDPSARRLEMKEASKRVFGVGYDFDNPDSQFVLENEEIDVLKGFLNDNFDEEGFYVRVDDSSAAAALKSQLEKLTPESLADVLSALADKHDLVAAIRKTGKADFLTSRLVGHRNLDTIEELQLVVNDPKSVEEDCRKILRDNPWMFGGQYVGVERTRQFTTLDQLDIVLVTGDGSLHVVELKRAFIPKLVVDHRNHLIVGADVHEAVSQTENYLRSLDEEAHTIKSKLGAEAHRVFATVVIGDRQHNKLEISDDDFYRALRTYNSHLSRIQVMTYDQLIANAMNALQIMFAETDEEQNEDEQNDDDDLDPPGDFERDDDPWARYDGPGPDPDYEPPF